MSHFEADAKAIFVNALDCKGPGELFGFLDQSCAGDPALRARVEELLGAHRDAGNFLGKPYQAEIMPAELVGEHPGMLIGPYKLLEQIGEGGFGVVYLAEQQHPVRRKVALKVLKPGMDTRQVVARFEAERQALALMDHPHIARVLDAGTTDSGRPYFVMELIRGIPITAFCDENRLALRERLELFLEVCQAVQHAHQKGIIHRDIKPSNVLVTLLDGTPAVKVIDFGIAKALGQVRLTDKTLLSGFGHMLGTPLYMSPEQAEMSGQDVDTRTDIYSLGVLLYELLTGTTPFDRERLKEAGYDEIRRIIREEEPAKPSTRISTLGQTATTVSANRRSEPKRLKQLFRGELDWIVMNALEKDRNRRYDTASSFAAEVQRYLDDEPVQACPPSAGHRLRKFARKYRMPLLVAAAFAFLLVVGMLVTGWQALRAGKAEISLRRLYYAASMRLVQVAWENQGILRVKKALAETAEFSERGFEWDYWQRLSHTEHLTLVGHQGGVTAVAFAPDGQRLVTGGTDGTARIWDATRGQELVALRGHQSSVMAVAFAPGGRWLVTGSTDGTARIWDAAEGRELRTLQGQSIGPVWAVAVTPDGKRVVAGNDDGTANVWDTASGQQLLTLKGHTAPPVFGAGTLGLLSSSQGQASFLAAAACYPGRTGHIGRILAIAATPDGRRLVTAGEDGSVRVWDSASGRELFTLKGHSQNVRSVAVTPDGRIVAAGENGTIRIWDAANGQEFPSAIGYTGTILAATLTPDGRRLITGTRHGVVKVWDLASGRELLVLMGHQMITGVAVSPDGQRLATAGYFGTARVWDLASGRGTWTLAGHSGPVRSIAVTANGQRLITGSGDGTVQIWDALNGTRLQELKGHSGPVIAIAFTRDGQRIVTGSQDGTARVWDAQTGNLVHRLEGHTGKLNSVAVTADGKRIVTGTLWAGEAIVWDAASGRVLSTFQEPNWLSVTPDGKWIVAGTGYGPAQIWDASSGHAILTLRGHTRDVSCVTLIPDSQRLVTGSIDGTAAVWDMTSGRRLLSLRGHAAPVTSVAVFPDGQRIVTGSEDGTARLWDAVSGIELLALKGHTGPVWCVAVTPDGRRIITGGEDGTIRFWEAASREEVYAWVRRDQEAEQRRTAWQKPDPNAPGFIRSWLILAPLKLEDGDNGFQGRDREQIPGEARLRPRAGDKADGWEGRWRAYHGNESILDFNRLVGKTCAYSAAYAVCYVISEVERNGLLLQVASDDQGKIYLNGQEIYKDSPGRLGFILHPVGPVTLRKGTNTLVFKVVNVRGDWLGAVRFLDRDGNPVQDLQESVTSDE
jgi:WD40 repeat protein/serine/threonine protein kinase